MNARAARRPAAQPPSTHKTGNDEQRHPRGDAPEGELTGERAIIHGGRGYPLAARAETTVSSRECPGSERRLASRAMPDAFVVNVADAPAMRHERGGRAAAFESPDDRFAQVGINVRILEPGQPASAYHSENMQEDFLVLSGQCLVILDGEERQLRAWDFVHCPPGTEHVFVGAGDGPCAILMVGARSPDKTLEYPANELAARYGASAARTTSSPAEAYADWAYEFTPTQLPWPPG